MSIHERVKAAWQPGLCTTVSLRDRQAVDSVRALLQDATPGSATQDGKLSTSSVLLRVTFRYSKA